MTSETAEAAEPPYLTATRTSYDAIASAYADRYGDILTEQPLDRALLAAFAELVLAGAEAPPSAPEAAPPAVVEVGSGPGRVAAHLASLGLAVRGVDLSPAMVDLARASFPQLRFDVGDMTALDLPDGSLGGLVSWYSLIHVPPEDHPRVLAEFHRVLAPGAPLLLAFQSGTEPEPPQHYDEGFGHPISLDFHRLDPERLAQRLELAGFAVRARLSREPEPTELTPQGYLLARKVGGGEGG